MPDVLKIATERREALLKEIAALDRFIEMANALLTREAKKSSTSINPLKKTATLKPTPAAQPSRADVAVDSETAAFLREREMKAGRPSVVTAQTAHPGIANLARN